MYPSISIRVLFQTDSEAMMQEPHDTFSVRVSVGVTNSVGSSLDTESAKNFHNSLTGEALFVVEY